MIDRRRLMLSSAGLGLIAALPAAARTSASEDARLDTLLQAQFDDALDRAPEDSTSLGLDIGARAGHRSRLDDRSVAAFEAEVPRNRERLDRLREINAAELSPNGRLSYDIALFQRELAVGYARFPWHTPDGWKQTPYGVSQLGGAYATVPDFLDSTHPIETLDDVEGFLNRLDTFPTALDQDTERMLANAEMGVIAPDFVLDKTRLQLIALRDQPGEQQAMIQSLVRRSAEKRLPNFGPGAARIFDGRVRDALTRQIAAVEALRLRSSHQAGVLRVPDGEAYYALNLRNFTTTDYSPADIHRIGLEQVADLQNQIDGLLKGEGYTQGTVAERLAGLRTEARFRFANTDAGREELLAFVNAEMASIRARMPEVFPRIPRNDFLVRRVPPAIEAGAPGGYAQGGSLDGSRPGIYYINLRDTAEWPRWTLKTLTYHEAAPGHLFQGALAREAGELPIYRRVGGFSAYSEGWGLYSERLADELGVYDDDPFGRIGYLESFLFRACRLVVDTGLHAQDWSRERAIQYFTENGGSLKDRPGFDLKRFHAAVIDGGNIPLTILERRVRAAMA
ncbi:MAG: Tat pathway signal sequence domain protein [bacterium]|nr:MAG: Tat pathway signal sequence domain protein [bacterium]